MSPRAHVLAALAALLLSPAALAQGRYEVTLRETEGDVTCDVTARGTAADLLVRALAKEAGLTVDGFDVLPAAGSISVQLKDRPLNEAVHTILGCVGLRARIGGGRIIVLRESPSFPEPRELEELADIAYQRALRLHPEHERSAEAELALSQIYAGWGEHARARARLEYLIDNYEDSELVPVARLQLGTILQKLAAWDDAALQFRALADIEESHPFHERARIELARSSNALGRYRQALQIVRSIDQNFPTSALDKKRDRLLVTAEAENGEERPIDALRTLEWYESLGDDPATEYRAMRIRGRALELSGNYEEASLAWLRHSQGAEGDEQAAALAEAARLALEGGNELGAIYIGAHGGKQGHGERLAPISDRARARLGLTPKAHMGGTPEHRTARAKELLARGLGEAARETIAPVYGARSGLAPDGRLELELLYARCVGASAGIDAALEVLRAAAADHKGRDARNHIYLVAAGMLEDAGRLDAAIAAYGGTL